MSADLSINLTAGVETEVQPKSQYTPPILHLEGKSTTVSLAMTDEQLSDVAYAIYKHLERTGAHEHPDEQRALNHELEEAAGNG